MGLVALTKGLEPCPLQPGGGLQGTSGHPNPWLWGGWLRLPSICPPSLAPWSAAESGFCPHSTVKDVCLGCGLAQPWAGYSTYSFSSVPTVTELPGEDRAYGGLRGAPQAQSPGWHSRAD